MLGRKHGTERTRRIHVGTENKTQHTAYLVIQFFGSYFSFLNELEVRSSQVIVVVGIAGTGRKAVGPATEFHVKTVGDGLFGVVHTTPVGNYHTIVSPFSFQNIIQQIRIVAIVQAFIKVVRTHNGPRLTFLYGSLEGRQVDFVQGTVVYNDVGVMTVHFVIVQGKVLHTGGHTVLLHTLNVRYYHTCCQIGIFAHVLKITAVERRAVYVDTRSQQHIFLAVAGLFANALPVEQ